MQGENKTTPFIFKCDVEDVGSVIRMRSERSCDRDHFSKLQENLAQYIIKFLTTHRIYHPAQRTPINHEPP